MQGFKKIHWKLWEELITQTLYRKVWRTDGQTGTNVNAPWQSSGGGQKKRRTPLPLYIKLPVDQKFDTNPRDFSLNFDLNYVKSTTCDGQS